MDFPDLQLLETGRARLARLGQNMERTLSHLGISSVFPHHSIRPIARVKNDPPWVS